MNFGLFSAIDKMVSYGSKLLKSEQLLLSKNLFTLVMRCDRIELHSNTNFFS